MKKPIMIEATASQAFEHFQRLIRGLAAVPKKEIEAEEERQRAERQSKKKSAKA